MFAALLCLGYQLPDSFFVDVRHSYVLSVTSHLPFTFNKMGKTCIRLWYDEKQTLCPQLCMDGLVQYDSDGIVARKTLVRQPG